MKIPVITSKNLLHVFKRKMINSHELNQYLKTHPDTNRRIGSLPVDFFKTIPEINKTEVTNKAGDIFERFSLDTANIEESTGMYLYGVKQAADKMVKALKTLLRRDDIESSYIDSGSFKNCQQLKIGDYSYALSTFKKYPVFDERGYFRASHGKGNEPQNIFTAYKIYSQGRICRPFFAKISSEKDDGGFILSKFIEPNHTIKKERGPFVTNRDCLKNTDVRGNSINGIFIEAGGFIPNKKRINNPKIKQDWKDFAICMDNSVKLLQNEQANQVQDYLMNLWNKGIDITDRKTFKSLFDEHPKEYKKIAEKLVKNLVQMRILKQKCINKGNFDSIQKILKEDLCDLYPFNQYSHEFCSTNSETDIYKGYPRLLTKELGINNVPPLKDMLMFLEDDACCAEIDFKKYYTKKEVLELNKQDFDNIKHLYSYKYMLENMNLKFIAAFRKQ